jgi:signal transduction histidine kinase
MALRLAASLSGVLVLSVAALGFVWLRHEYGDLSARHARAQEALRYQERQAAIGTLAATVAHEIRNPLNGIAISVQRLRREFPCGPDEPDASWRELTDVLESETRRLDGRVQQFLEFARPPQPVFRAARASTVTADVVAAMRPFAERRQVRLHSNVETTPLARLDADQLRQALENIVRNAIEATPAGSAVRVECRQTPHETRIDVADEGAGIPVEQLPRIFDLYFTTKPDGSGIGLAIARQIVAAHGGTIDVASEAGAGTRMTIHLPRHEQADAGTDAVDR